MGEGETEVVGAEGETKVGGAGGEIKVVGGEKVEKVETRGIVPTCDIFSLLI